VILICWSVGHAGHAPQLLNGDAIYTLQDQIRHKSTPKLSLWPVCEFHVCVLVRVRELVRKHRGYTRHGAVVCVWWLIVLCVKSTISTALAGRADSC
jgi:hypothetical protein